MLEKVSGDPEAFNEARSVGENRDERCGVTPTSEGRPSRRAYLNMSDSRRSP